MLRLAPLRREGPPQLPPDRGGWVLALALLSPRPMEKTELIQKAELAERYDNMVTSTEGRDGPGAPRCLSQSATSCLWPTRTWSGAAGPPGGSS